MRLDKYLAESWVGQRKQVREMIRQGRVTVNGEVICEAPYEVDCEQDEVRYDGVVIHHPGKRYYMFHKPAGCITARKDDRHETVLDYFTEELRPGLFPVGRLDKDTEGLLLLTNDGELDYQLMNPVNHVAKTYYFWALGSLTQEQCQMLETGVDLGKGAGVSKPARFQLVHQGYYDEFSYEIDQVAVDLEDVKHSQYRKPVVSGYLTITEGKKHQVKRMLHAVGCYVIALKRTSIGSLMLDESLQPGAYRELTQREVELLIPQGGAKPI